MIDSDSEDDDVYTIESSDEVSCLEWLYEVDTSVIFLLQFRQTL